MVQVFFILAGIQFGYGYSVGETGTVPESEVDGLVRRGVVRVIGSGSGDDGSVSGGGTVASGSDGSTFDVPESEVPPELLTEVGSIDSEDQVPLPVVTSEVPAEVPTELEVPEPESMELSNSVRLPVLRDKRRK